MTGLVSPKTLSLIGMFDVTQIIQSGGLLLIALIIFAESGMFVGFFFPGDTLLMTAGIFAAQGHLNIAEVIAVIAFAAILGDNVGYMIGKRYGPALFKKKDGVVFRQAYIQRAEKFYERWGSRTMLLSHFVPVVRTFAPPVAGVAKMNHKKFFIYDAIGIIAWSFIVTMIGYWFGTKIPNIDHYIILAVVGVMAFTLGPTFYHLGKALLENRRKKQGKTDAGKN
jgi:membrane-associated protein